MAKHEPHIISRRKPGPMRDMDPELSRIAREAFAGKTVEELLESVTQPPKQILTLRVDESEHGFAISVLDDEDNFMCHVAFGFATELDVSEDLTRLTAFFKSKGLIVRHTVDQ